MPKTATQRIEHEKGCDYRGRHLRGAEISWCEDGDFDGANLESGRLYKLRSCQFRKACLRSADLGHLQCCELRDAQLQKADLSHISDCSFKGADLAGAHFSFCEPLGKSDFTGANLRETSGGYFDATEVTFRGADLSRCEYDERCIFAKADFRAAKLIEAVLVDGQLAGANLEGANLSGALLARADLRKANLRRANLKGANLAEADLTGAVLDGANFEEAVLPAAKVSPQQIARARHLSAEMIASPGKRGPNLQQLSGSISKGGKLETSIQVYIDGKQVYLHASPTVIHYSHQSRTLLPQVFANAENLGAAMLSLARMWRRGEPRLDSIEVKASKCRLRGNALKQLVIAAWSEAFGLAPPSEEQTQQITKAQKTATNAAREAAVSELRQGLAGVKKWNKRPAEEHRKLGKLVGADLSGANLDGVDFRRCNLEQALLEGASLKKARLGDCRFKSALLRNANLSSAQLNSALLSDANLEGADLTKAWMREVSLKNANLKGANLDWAELSGADLCGADLSTAQIDKADFGGARFDEATKWPKAFRLPENIRWWGDGVDPRKQLVTLAKADQPLDFDLFVKRLSNVVAEDRIRNALKMLRASRFQLFNEVSPSALLGVVRSQTDKDLVYSCRLTSTGNFSCCTQNLHPCGGLRGAPCKHILVLILGLAHVGQINLEQTESWLLESQKHDPELDRELMSETFLRYKGAEAGEVDWRPTETIPEDYYAL